MYRNRIGAIMLLCMLLASTSAMPAYASETDPAVTASSSAENADDNTEQDAAEDSDENTKQDTEEDPVKAVIKLINGIDADKPDDKAVSEAKMAYDELSTAQKTKVDNYAILDAAEKALSENNPEEILEDGNTKRGTQYSFRISDYARQVTIVMNHVTDSDDNGQMEAPDITLMSPDDREIVLQETTSKISNDACDIDVMRGPSYTQLDVTWAQNGTWTIVTSNEVLFSLDEYAGNSPEQTVFSPHQDENTLEQQPSVQDPGIPVQSIVILIVFVAAIAVAFVFIGRIGKGKKANTGKDGDTEKHRKNTVAARNNDGGPQPLTDEEEIRLIREEWESMKEQFRDEETEEDDSIKSVDAEEDNRLYMTTEEDIRNDDSIEELDDDDSFFGKSRFG